MGKRYRICFLAGKQYRSINLWIWLVKLLTGSTWSPLAIHVFSFLLGFTLLSLRLTVGHTYVLLLFLFNIHTSQPVFTIAHEHTCGVIGGFVQAW